MTFGTRPEAIKMAPVVHECRRRPEEIEPIVCLTGQHREMLAQVTDYFGIEADVDLALMRPNQSLAELTGRCLTGLDEVLARYRPDCVVAQGDTTTVMCAALAAFYRRIPFVHVEAGLRTGDMQAPWPEEMNRRVAGLVTALHCAPTRRAADNLLAERVAAETVHVTGNTVIDALLWAVDRERGRGAPWRRKYAALGERRMVLVTGHRRENFGGGMENICRAIATLAQRFGEVEFVYPVHLNPNVREPVQRLLAGLPNVHLLEPAPYPEFVWLMDRSTLILTDSGGVQEEAPSLKKPVLVMRDTTERPEALEAGAVELVGTDATKIVSRAGLLLTDPAAYRSRQLDINPYGDGRAAERIVSLVLEHFAAGSDVGRKAA
ncbi:MAG TPA: UDP-N-acetylglucosamine 2-epimerase (non-hydrolyzing) [Pirellulales bacterium]|nr:UDP-N-acetylglucosamine 2-epimerase (non-hydrolyzing) [Pirellulales bacterium]